MWEDLNMKEKAALINIGVTNGLRDLNDIRAAYNNYINGDTNYIDEDTNIYAKGGKKQKGNPRAAAALNYFMSKGLTKEQAAGLVGNFMIESGLNNTARNPSSGAYGIAQWLGPRKTALIQRYGNNPSLYQQLDFVWHELNTTHKKGLTALRNSKTADEAAANAFGYYEFSGGPQAAINAMNRSGMNTKWKNPNGTYRLNKGVNSARSLLNLNPTTQYMLDSPIVINNTNVAPAEIPELKFFDASSLNDDKEDTSSFELQEPQEEVQEPNPGTMYYNIYNMLGDLKPAKDNNSLNNYQIHI